MEELCIIYEYSKISGVYGIGTFVRQISLYLQLYVKFINIIEINRSDICEFEVEYKHGINYVRIPRLQKHEYTTISKLLQIYILKERKLCVILNNKEHYELIVDLKTRINSLKIIYVIHYFSWMWLIKGNIQVFINHIKSTDNNAMSRSIYETFKLEQTVAQYSDIVICLSNDSYELIRSVYKVDNYKLYIIHNGLFDKYELSNLNQKDLIESKLPLNQNEKIILYVGRIEALKGVEVLIKSFTKVSELHAESRLVIIGSGDILDIDMTGRKITFTGRISQEEVAKWYQIADVGVMPSYSEECSFVGIEMMMHGLPIVASNGRGVRNMFHHMQNCLSVDCQSGIKVFEKELSEAIVKILDSETLANELRKKSRQWYLDNYQLKFMQQKYLSLIEDIIK